MALTVLLVQHAEKRPEPGDPGLTERGHRQAVAVARALGESGISHLYSSPSLRTLETAEPITQACGVPIKVDDRLRERMNWGGPDSGQDLGRFLADWTHATLDRDFVPLAGDSSRAAGSRLEQFVRELRDDDAIRTVAVVTHGGVTVDFLRNIAGDDELARFGPTLMQDGMPGGGLTEITWDGGSWTIDRVADVRHIPAIDRTGHRAS